MTKYLRESTSAAKLSPKKTTTKHPQKEHKWPSIRCDEPDDYDKADQSED
jgi:hypothetical protein